MTKPAQARISQQRDVHMYAELWHASKCVLQKGLEDEKGCSWQFLSSIVLTAFCFEAYLNHVGATQLSCWRTVESLSPLKKFELICELLKVNFPKGFDERPLQNLKELQLFRNTMAHGKTETLSPRSKLCDVNKADERLGRRPLSDWERRIRQKDFAERAQADLEEVLIKIHAARPEPKEHLFYFGIGQGSASLVDPQPRQPGDE